MMIGPGELDTLRREVERSFVHRYTRTPRVGGADDAWGDQSFSSGTPQTNRPCRYREQSQPVVGPNGLEIVNLAFLLVPTSDPLTAGDLVSNITDSSGAVLVAGPVEVEDNSPRGLLAGGPLHREIRIRQVQNV